MGEARLVLSGCIGPLYSSMTLKYLLPHCGDMLGVRNRLQHGLGRTVMLSAIQSLCQNRFKLNIFKRDQFDMIACFPILLQSQNVKIII